MSAIMRANRSRDTRPELLVRRRLHALGYRYRVALRIEGTHRSIDIAFTRQKTAVFIDGCFWHGCSQHYRPALINRGFWETKGTAARVGDV